MSEDREIIQSEYLIPVPGSQPIPVIVDRPRNSADNGEEERPIVLILHGFKGFATWGFFPYVAERIAGAGMITLRVNFSHNGVQGFGEDFSRLDLFEKNTFGREIDEVGRVLTAIREGEIPGVTGGNRGRIGLLGHSRGGGIALLSGARYSEIDAIVTWSAVSTFERYTERQLARWREEGFLEVRNSRTGQVMRLGSDLLRELENEGKNLDIASAVHDLDSPLLILHGAVDLSVSVDNAERLLAAADQKNAEIKIIPATGHTYGVGHPFSGSSPALEKALEHSISFLSEHLR